MQRAEYEEGDIKFFMRVGQDGHVRWAYPEESSLGDRDTEKCMMDAITQAQWPRPDGGEAEVHRSEPFDAPDVREPVAYPTDRLAGVLGGKDGDEVRTKCQAKGNNFLVTAYIAPDKNDGKVEAVGVSTKTKEGNERLDCIAEQVKGWKVPTPGSYAGKVSFKL
jgi:hypothetical protein